MSPLIFRDEGDNLVTMNILIVGLGAIGAGFGGPRDGENHAFLSTKAGFTLVGGVDLGSEKRSEFTRRYGAPTFSSVELAANLYPDVVVIATDAVNHKKSFDLAIEYFPSTILICEKPFGSSYAESLSMAETALGKNVKMFVNYSRQHSIGYRNLLTNIQGSLQGGTVVYNYGITRSCSHFIRLCIGLFGEPLNVRTSRQDFGQNSNPSFTLEYGDGIHVEFVGVQNLGTRIGEFNLITDTEVIQISQGIYWELKKKELKENPSWVADLEEITRGSFSGGLANLYSDLFSIKVFSLNPEILHDALPNKIIDKVLKNEK